MMLEDALEDAWRGLSQDDLEKDVAESRQRILERKALLIFAELDLEIGERVLREISNG